MGWLFNCVSLVICLELNFFFILKKVFLFIIVLIILCMLKGLWWFLGIIERSFFFVCWGLFVGGVIGGSF